MPAELVGSARSYRAGLLPVVDGGVAGVFAGGVAGAGSGRDAVVAGVSLRAILSRDDTE